MQTPLAPYMVLGPRDRRVRGGVGAGGPESGPQTDLQTIKNQGWSDDWALLHHAPQQRRGMRRICGSV